MSAGSMSSGAGSSGFTRRPDRVWMNGPGCTTLLGPPVVGGQAGRLRGRAEIRQHGGKALRIVVMGHVTRARKDLEPAAGHRLVRGATVLGRDDRVLLAPHDQRRED